MAKKKIDVKDYKQKAMAELAKAKEKFKAHETNVKKYVKKNPAKAVAIAAGIGAALGAVAGAIALRKRK
jgi:ElaB/YqjD/DUF883 family membrane-anchored ribosome-binding protein